MTVKRILEKAYNQKFNIETVNEYINAVIECWNKENYAGYLEHDFKDVQIDFSDFNVIVDFSVCLELDNDGDILNKEINITKAIKVDEYCNDYLLNVNKNAPTEEGEMKP